MFERLYRIIEIPEFIRPWLHRFYEAREVELLAVLADGGDLSAFEAGFLDRCHKRGVIDFDERGRPEPADFHGRYEVWALFEGRQDLPAEVCDRLNRWELDSFIESHGPVIDAAAQDGIRHREAIWSEYVLMHEARAIVEQVPHIYLWPCNCRAMMRGCRKPDLVCLRFDNHRGLGWEISKERAAEILKHSFRKGLMQCAELGLQPDGTMVGGICNCCADCCFPQQLSVEAGGLTSPCTPVEGGIEEASPGEERPGNSVARGAATRPGTHGGFSALYPLKRYEAEHDAAACVACGRCASRCPFGAFSLTRNRPDPSKPVVKQIQFDPKLCRGCGLCAGTCKAAAISMRELETVLSLVNEILSFEES